MCANFRYDLTLFQSYSRKVVCKCKCFSVSIGTIVPGFVSLSLSMQVSVWCCVIVLVSLPSNSDSVSNLMLSLLWMFLWLVCFLFFSLSSPSVQPTQKPNTCPNNGFQCKNYKHIKCVSASEKCDFKNDCEDSSDESAEVCGSPCKFENNMCGWREAKPNNFDWTRFHGCTAQSITCSDAVGSTSGK